MINVPAEKISEMYDKVDRDLQNNIQNENLSTPRDLGEFRGEIPHDLDMLSNDDIANLMVKVQEYQRCVNSYLSDARNMKKVKQRILKGVKSAITIERGKEHVESDPRYIESDCALLYWEMKEEYLEDISKSASKSYQMISRLIALREQDLQQTTRREVFRKGGRKTYG